MGDPALVGEADDGWAGVPGAGIGAAFDGKVVVTAAFDHAGVGAVPDRVAVAAGGDLAGHFAVELVLAVRGKNRPGRRGVRGRSGRWS